MKFKNILPFASICIILGFCGGLIIGIYFIHANRYIFYSLNFIAAYTLHRYLMIGGGVGILTFIFLSGTLFLTLYVNRFILKGRTHIITRKLYIIIMSSFLSMVSIFMMHKYWYYFASRAFHPLIFFYSLLCVLCVFCGGWLLYKYNFESIITNYSKSFFRLAVCSIFIIVCFNLMINLYERFFIPKLPDIILISIDTLRADHLGCYGYRRNTSPNIDEFAKQGILFKKAYAQEPWTLPSHMSIMTGLYPLTHGVRNDTTTKLPPAICTLAEILKNYGYTTAGFASGGIWMNPEWGFKQGFDFYNLLENYSTSDLTKNAEYENKFIRSYLKRKKKKNNFLFIHYFDVHSDTEYLPYDAPFPYKAMFNKPGMQIDFAKKAEGAVATEYLSYLNKHNISLSQEERDYLIDLYDNGIAYIDKYIGELLNILKEFNLYNNALIIITSDHGEAFQEHNYMLHGFPYYHEEQIHVPLLVKLPNHAPPIKGLQVENMVELIDIMPSILKYLDISFPFVQGLSFFDLSKDRQGKEYLYGLTSNAGVFIRSERWKMIGDDGLNKSRFQLFDLKNDPEEHYNLIDKLPYVKNIMYTKLIEKVRESENFKAQLTGLRSVMNHKKVFEKGFYIDKEQKERLKALGYVQ